MEPRSSCNGAPSFRSAWLAAAWLMLLGGVAWAEQAPEVLYYTFNEGSGTTTENLAQPGQGEGEPEFVDGNGNPVAPEWVGDPPLGSHGIGVQNFPTRLPTGFDPATLNGTDWTIEFWLRVPSTLDRREAVFSDGSDFGAYVHPGGHMILFDNTTNSTVTTDAVVTTGEWVHVAFVYRSAPETVATFINGTRTNTAGFDYDIEPGELFVLRGGFYINLGGGNLGIWSFENELDEFRLWSQARSDVEIFLFRQREAPFEAGMHVWHLPGPVRVLPVAEEDGNVPAGRFVGYNVVRQAVSGVTVEQLGTAENNVDVTLWADNQVDFDPGSATPLGTATLSEGVAEIEVEPSFDLGDEAWRIYFLTVEPGAQTEGGSTIALRVAEASSLAVNDGPVHTLNADFPFEWSELTVFGPHRSLPFSTNWDTVPHNLRMRTGARTYPTATEAGSAPSEVSITDSTQARLSNGESSGLTPSSGQRMVGIDFPNGDSIGAIDLHFQLEGLDAQMVPLQLQFDWNNTGLQANPANNVFISLDGGETWETSLYHFPLPQSEGWHSASANISALLEQAQAPSTELSDLVIRFQARGAQAFDDDGLLIDNVSLSLGSWMRVQRVGMGQTIPHEGTDDWGMIAGPGTTSVVYALENVGHAPLNVFEVAPADFQFTGTSGLVEVDFEESRVLSPGEIATVPVRLILDDEGGASFELQVSTNDPTFDGGLYHASVTTEAQNLPPTIRPAPAAVAISGSQADGFSYEAVLDEELGTMRLLADDPNGDPVEILAIEGHISGVEAPVPSAPQTGPVELIWSGTPEQAGSFTYTIEVDDGEQTTTTTLTVLVQSEVEDRVASISCGALPARASSGPVAVWLLLATLLLLGLSRGPASRPSTWK